MAVYQYLESFHVFCYSPACMNCALCVARDQEPGRIVYQNQHVFVLVNIEPVKRGHVMILPVRHAEELKDLEPLEAQAFLQTLDRCMKALGQVFDETPICVVNGWKHRSQPHLHAHVLPSQHSLRALFSRAENVGERKRAEMDVLHRMADELREYFRDT